ncbi:MAG: nicotinate-nucleotide adenylyltransferase [Rhodobacterales bacterium]|nr:nicotinate-nucleotide adenylyltransferase [Rhodobacterales bacterium]
MAAPLPFAPAGMTVGLLGGSFDPPHEGHVHITRAALVRFQLDRVWWLVSPGNPLKAHGPAPVEQRMAAARAIMRHPRVTVTDIEARIGTRYTAETLAWLTSHYPGVRFVWLMGADNLAQFHRWQEWRRIMEMVPLGVLARPGEQMGAQLSKAARVYRNARLPAAQAQYLGYCQPPAWCFVNLPLMAQSSSAIRAAGEWG